MADAPDLKWAVGIVIGLLAACAPQEVHTHIKRCNFRE